MNTCNCCGVRIYNEDDTLCRDCKDAKMDEVMIEYLADYEENILC